MRASLFLVLLCSVLTSACHERVTSELRVDHVGWDTLRITAGFAQEGVLGEARRLDAEGVEVRVFDADYDTLYVGDGPLVPVPDARLGDREALLVEVCRPVDGQRVCEQEAVAASPKRVRGTLDVRFPQGSDYRLGRYDVTLEAERARFDADGWEPIERPPGLEAWLVASVADAPGDPEEGRLRVPVAPGEGRFDLARADGHDDFAYHLRSRLHDARAAEVRFELHARLGREPERLAVATAEVEEKTRADRAAELAAFVQQAAEAIVERLGVFERARVYIDDWSYDAVLNAYEAEVEVVGRSGAFFDRLDRDRLRGALRVREDGARAVFTLEEATREVEEAWRDAIGDATFRLGTLEPAWERETPDEEPATAQHP